MADSFSFGYWLRRQRLARDLRQADLAGRLGVAPITLRKIEADERRPSLQLLDRIAELFALSEEERALLLRVARADLSPAALPLSDSAKLPELARYDKASIAREAAPASLPSGTVTFLFTDIAGSSGLWEDHPAAMAAALSQHDALLHAAIVRHDGVVIKGTGDGLIAAFALPEKALASALDAQRALEAVTWAETGPLRVRMAIHSGAAEPRAGDYLGPTLNRAARLLAAGHGGQILLSLATSELLRDSLPREVTLRELGSHQLKDLTRPEQILQAATADLPADFPPLRTLRARQHNLPAQTTVWIGREPELAELCALLRRPELRLVTLIGPGGTGKTRLALQASAELFEQFPQGVWFVNLASITEPALVMSAIARTLDIREQSGRTLAETLCSALREQKLLLLLDNFEQVVAAAPHIAKLLAEVARVTILVTSREALRLSGERLVAVAPLAVPEPHQLAKAGKELPLLIGQYDAVQLFSDRARAVRADFTVTQANGLAVAGICARLDGLPLAIELAAVRMRLFSPAALLERLDHRLQLLSSGLRDMPARQQTLRATIEWSYALLNDEEQRCFRRLSVFFDGCTIAGAMAVTERTESEGLDLLTALVDKSLLRHAEGPGSEPRFTMLETIREYAVEQLAQHDETAITTERHAAYFLQVAIGAEAQLRDSQAQICMAQLEAEHNNLRAALHWYHMNGYVEHIAQLCFALWRFWFDRGLWGEGQEAVAPVVDEQVLAHLPAKLQAGALLCAGLFAARQSSYDQARSFLERGLTLYRQIGAYGEQADALFGLSIVAHGRSDYAEAARYLREAEQCSHGANDRFRVALYLGWLGYMTQILGKLSEAQALVEESVRRFRELGCTDQVGVALSDLGFHAYARGELTEAVALLEEGVGLLRQSGNRYQLSSSLNYLAQAIAAQQELALARELYAESLALRRSMGDRRGLVPVLVCMARAATSLGALQDAHGELREALMIAREIAYNQGYAWVLLGTAHLVALTGEVSLAVSLLGAEEALRERCNLPIWPSDRPLRAEVAGPCRSTLSDEAFAAAWGAGRALTLDEALSFVVKQLDGTTG
jgi:predicted ATPase/class 3 adenylate cyclase